MRLLTEVEAKSATGGLSGMDDPVDLPPVDAWGPPGGDIGLPPGGGGGIGGGGIGGGQDGGGNGGGAGTPTFKWDAPVTFSAVGKYDANKHTNSLTGTYDIANGWVIEATTTFSPGGNFSNVTGTAKFTDASGYTSHFSLISNETSFLLNGEYNTGFSNGWSLKITADYNATSGAIEGKILLGHAF